MDLHIQMLLTPIRVQPSMNEVFLWQNVFSLFLIKVLIVSGERERAEFLTDSLIGIKIFSAFQ